MGAIKDLTGCVFGKLKVLNHTGRQRVIMWNCECECGNIHITQGTDLKAGKIKSCGCDRYTNLKQRNTTHGFSNKEKLYSKWRSMISRCRYPSATGYENYGGRGITVCKEWVSDYLIFREWALSNGYTDSLSIERVDVNGDYEPTNCKWIPFAEQYINKRKRKSMPDRNRDGTFKSSKKHFRQP